MSKGKKYFDMSMKNFTVERKIEPPRAIFCDRNNTIIADNIHKFDLIISTNKRKRYLEITNKIKEFIPDIKINKYNFSHILKRNINWEELCLIERLDIPEVYTKQDYKRVYIFKSVANLIGNLVTENRKLSSGLESFLLNKIKGKEGIEQMKVNAFGEILSRKATLNPEQNPPVQLSICMSMQNKAYELISETRIGCVLVTDLKTGEILVSASHPSVDTNNFNQDWNDHIKNRDNPLLNRVSSGLYPIGSIMKIFATLYLLENNIVDENTTVNCDGEFTLGNHTFKCWKSHGQNINLQKAISESCDIYFYTMSKKVDLIDYLNFLRKLGFQSKIDVMHNEKKGFFIEKKRYYLYEKLLTLIGQGFFQCTPLELTLMMNRFLSNSNLDLKILKNENSEMKFENNDENEKPLFSVKNIEMLGLAMKNVLQKSKGTAHYAWIINKKPDMGGKTGTAQVCRLSKEEYGLSIHKKKWERREHSLFCGYLPSDNPRYCITVVTEHDNLAKSIAIRLSKYIESIL
ncbi:penicillin-binding transpeptidase domain-containing protein [Candidatus Nesciobacter abundans]|uniref:penicillin-binding transpeptidase domain-containing protein n=1 Tax=Candidatus Nesciobacter abundans TaxID=2601668 RepID=UPI0016535FB0|nr:penicillin-binding transpeptidase domain-containing protein [Candidatus Nesciobacter abundans]